MFRMVAIPQGSAVTAEAEETGRRVRPMAAARWRQALAVPR